MEGVATGGSLSRQRPARGPEYHRQDPLREVGAVHDRLGDLKYPEHPAPLQLDEEVTERRLPRAPDRPAGTSGSVKV